MLSWCLCKKVGWLGDDTIVVNYSDKDMVCWCLSWKVEMLEGWITRKGNIVDIYCDIGYVFLVFGL